MMHMKVLHTSDWHLGNSFHEKKRTREFEAFFGWLLELVERERVDLLLVSGDVFDNGTPGTQALEIYFNFLGKVAETGCRHVIIIAGNHDSPSLLSAPRELLKNLNIHVISSASSDPADEVLVLDDESGEPSVIICAVPYLRDRDVRCVSPGESIEEKAAKLLDGVRDHYRRIQETALVSRKEAGRHVPIIVMGHLYTRGSVLSEDDTHYETVVGTLAGVGLDVFLPEIDYCALGHLHRPQCVGGSNNRRYCGAPLPMEFSDSPQPKLVVIVEFGPEMRETIREVPIPCFQEMERVRGTFREIGDRIRELAASGDSVWVEAILDDPMIVPDFQEKLNRMVRGTGVEILVAIDTRNDRYLLGQESPEETLEELSEIEVFTRCLDANKVDGQERPDLMSLFCEVLDEIRVGDSTGDEM
jgi:exonuclease SbcD